jgi:hypothetical protein
LTHSGGSLPANNNVAAPQRKRFSLTGRRAALDPRFNAVRGDLADIELADRVFAPHYAKSCRFKVIADVSLQDTPSSDGAIVAILKKGEYFDLLDISGGWGWGRCSDAVGYVEASAIEVL